MHFISSFCSRIENNSSSLSIYIYNFESCRSLGNKPHFLRFPWDCRTFKIFELSFYSEVLPDKAFLQRFKLCFYRNIHKFMKFSNLGNRSFEADFNPVQTLLMHLHFHLEFDKAPTYTDALSFVNGFARAEGVIAVVFTSPH